MKELIYSGLILLVLCGVIYGFARVLAWWIDRNVKLTLEIVEKEETKDG